MPDTIDTSDIKEVNPKYITSGIKIPKPNGTYVIKVEHKDYDETIEVSFKTISKVAKL